jgi:hypothetical protein
MKRERNLPIEAMGTLVVLLFRATMLISLVPLMAVLFVVGLAYATIALATTLCRRAIWLVYRIGLLKYDSPSKSEPKTSSE